MGNVWYKFIDNPPKVRLFLVYNRQISIEMLNRAKTYEKKDQLGIFQFIQMNSNKSSSIVFDMRSTYAKRL